MKLSVILFFLILLSTTTVSADIDEHRCQYKSTDPFYREYAKSQGWEIPTCYAIPGAPTTYHVKTTGNDSTGDGSEGNPWATVQKGADEATAGDTVYVHSGTYTLSSRVDFDTNNGSAGNYITFVATPANTANIDASNVTIGFYYGAFDVNVDYVIIDGFNIYYSDMFGVCVKGADHVTVRNNFVYGCEGSGIWSGGNASGQGGGTNYTFHDNDIENCCTGQSPYIADADIPAQEGISLVGVTGFDVYNNKVHDFPYNYIDAYCNEANNQCPKEGIDMKVGCSNGRVYNNEVYEVREGIYIDARGNSGSIAIYNNLVYDIVEIGLAVGDELNSSDITDVSFYNNIVHDCTYDSFQITNANLFTNIYYYNNTSDGAGRSNIFIREAGANIDNFVCFNNIFGDAPGGSGVDPTIEWQNGGYDSGEHHKSYNLFYNTPYFGDNYQTGDPGFDTGGTTGYELLGESSCRDNGIDSYQSVSVPSTDYSGNARPFNPASPSAVSDIGALEWQGTPAGTPTATSEAIFSWNNAAWSNYESVMGSGTENYASVCGVDPVQ